MKVKLKLKTYTIVTEAIERGLQFGWNKAHKYTDSPTMEQILDQQEHYIGLELDSVVKFDD